MRLTSMLLAFCAVGWSAALPAPASAQGTADATAQSQSDEFARFNPRPGGNDIQLDYAFWDDTLDFMVLRMGPSTRDMALVARPSIGSRIVYGHQSRLRMEGNRIVYSFLHEDAIRSLSEYRADLERIGSEIDLASLPRNEQLAFWLNLHNVAIIEQIGLNYPVRMPSRIMVGPDRVPLDEAAFIKVAGVMMSPRDIRTKIVYPNWSDPDVIYGFHRGDIGGPSIQRLAFTADNVDGLLDISAREFVNSLRGVEGSGNELLVSSIYAEAAPFYFTQFGDDLRTHLRRHATEEVADLIGQKPALDIGAYEDMIADVAGGEREPVYNLTYSNDQEQSARYPQSVLRFMLERNEKLTKLRDRGELQGTVIVLPLPEEKEADDAAPASPEGGNDNRI